MRKLAQYSNIVPLAVCLLSSPSWAGQKALGHRAVDNWQVDGQHGLLRVKGSLTDSPCRLSMRTADQTVDLGNVALGALPHIGSTGPGVTFRVELMDCLAVANAQGDRQTGLVPWSLDQPGVSIRFVSVTPDASGRYATARGISGLGLAITEVSGKLLPLGTYSPPHLLPAGQSVLTYRVQPVRLAKWVSPGAFYAELGFQLSYE